MKKLFLNIVNLPKIQNNIFVLDGKCPEITKRQKTMNILCKVVGHTWNYKDYSFWMKENGDNYDFKASRNCIICKQNEYLFEDWKSQTEKSPYDVESNIYSTRKLAKIE